MVTKILKDDVLLISNHILCPLKVEYMKEHEMNRGVPQYIRALAANGDSILVDLLSAYGNLIYRGVVMSSSETAINNAIEPGIYNHGAGLYGTGNGWHGILIVLKAGSYVVQIDIPQQPQDHVIFWRLIGGKWEKITSVTV